ncbi:glutathione-specific gamma-glutamylcyclotransferase 1 isoform X1 [Zeugodacus cucurbitae]|uniref:glutathione-specific gamma-glutamylcyclotransferase n=1 Tax=Zeugodacus cucurbitae TaxID=28588 RepID=A0A0A1X779_ZEUCU|nr:glutathione-specific gamma-glutamylcyclotransferase 1 isoform X1 [Zeugodacus cucurbitae]XP_028900144.1 glutathione-specific gamma-glutamylcyclotransferase 1 isoform X1 [Zeugodacus cucurbitae]XP_054081880.1 glutathione-specific gamma-glutamylcyclotransferase 1 isoform X1 [Zeugodacus cucurbitae]
MAYNHRDLYNNNNPNNNDNLNDNPAARGAPEYFENLFLNGNFAANVDEEMLDAAAAVALAERNNVAEHANYEPSCWVFGYGSLCWYPGFEYSKCITGYIKGFVRRFWQGNTTHRGTDEKPGRVATLIEDKEVSDENNGITWGCAYKITGSTALEYLKQRECKLGGYIVLETKFFPRVASFDTPFSGEAVPVLVYVATPDNCHWLGEDTSDNIAEQIVECRGPSGHNVEYLLRLADFMREEIPDVVDPHLFELEFLVREKLHKRQIPLWSVMGVSPDRIRRDSHEEIRRPPTFEFTSRIPERKLRCLNI